MGWAFRGKVWGENINLGVMSTEMVFKAMKMETRKGV